MDPDSLIFYAHLASMVPFLTFTIFLGGGLGEGASSGICSQYCFILPESYCLELQNRLFPYSSGLAFGG